MNNEKWELVVKAVKELEHYVNNEQFLVTVFTHEIDKINYYKDDKDEITSINLGGDLHIANYEKEIDVIPYLQRDILIYQLKKELLPESILNLDY